MHYNLNQFHQNLNKRGLQKYFNSFCVLIELAKEIDEIGGQTLFVGGTVRDMIFGTNPKDFDIEIHRVNLEIIDQIASKYGKISKVGKSFGILKLSIKNGLEIDISTPRRDSKSGVGHKGFEIEVDVSMGIKEACRRRDFTINSLVLDLINGEIFDYYGGLEDLNNKVLRIVDKNTFIDDPLRVFRGIGFIGRFSLRVEKETRDLMISMIPSLKELSIERISEEWKKLLLKSSKPSNGLDFALEIGLIKQFYPELAVLKQTEQEPEWHPEGDVWTHTMLAIDKSADILSKIKITKKDKLTILLATLCHDLGKATTTEIKNNRITSYDHEKQGEEPTKKFLKSIGIQSDIIDKVIPLVVNHLAPVLLHKSEIEGGKISDGAIRRLASRLYPATIKELVIVAEADYYGRGFIPGKSKYLAGKWLLERASKLKVESKKPENIISGKELIDLGFEPGRKMGEIINLANKLRDENNLDKKEIIIEILKFKK